MDFLKTLSVASANSGVSTGSNWLQAGGPVLSSFSPVDGSVIATVTTAAAADYDRVVTRAQAAFHGWSALPAPRRGEIIRQVGLALREKKEALGRLVSWEMGKSLQEGLGEVQEMIDISDFAVGLSRQLYGRSMHSERPGHRMYEQWHPLGVTGIITAFNFPVAVWSWNAFVALVCGNTVIWKPSEKTPLCAVACQQIIAEVLARNDMSEGVSNVIVSGREGGEWLAGDSRIALISATGSTRMGRSVAAAAGARLGRTLLELGGNNAIIITPEADLDMALAGSIFGAVGTAGQRCTTTRRLIIHEEIYDRFKEKLVKIYGRLRIGDPLDENNHVGPLIDKDAVLDYLRALEAIREAGGVFVVEGGQLEGPGYESGCYVKPCVAEVENSWEITQRETFAPILYLIRYRDSLDAAIALQNGVPQGLSSAIMTGSLREAEQFLSAAGSDCGIANVNIGTSGAEIGGAFGGEKDTGGGRESGSDAWKAYMRRQTSTINYSTSLPLAQGVRFDV
ncbi:L-piperidine-6-carboxylate dehydrogenase [Compostibacter hankyongensis]|uniref:aldehyde dehydrogenase (NAD(+)) n=1 Tax=Compostibacter hankyongensis TaxID=1007089 RepID=A0ABP8FM43_9BACT